ncbi:MAG: fimbrillin family protein [Segatella oulorum]|uniref:fimbrillin family protein n=1 Tax=Segatella oulorum TaxID=28136 RepID=UPI00361E3691
MKRKFLDNHSLRHALPFAAACFTVGLTLFACADKDVETNDNNGKALVAFNVSEKQDEAQDQAKAAAKAGQPMTRAAFANQLALQNLAPEDLTMQKLPVQGAAASSDICLIETTVPGLPSQWEDDAPTRANITTMPTMQNFSTTAFYGYSDTSLAPWFYDKDTNKDGTLVTPIYWDWFKNHACFYAVYPKPDNNKIKLSPESYTGTPYVDFEVEPNVRNQKDLMTACSGNVHTDIGAMSATAPRTDLTFHHALTAVRFKVGENLSWNKRIRRVDIINAKSKGRYILPNDKNASGTWVASSLTAPRFFRLGVNVSTSEAVNNVIIGKDGDNCVFYMIPQDLTGVSVKIYLDNITTPTITANLSGTWKPGTTKTYALSQNTSTWQYELTVTPPAAAEYNATSTSNYKIQSYRKDPSTNTQQNVAWKVVGYDTNGDGVFSMTEPWPNWFKGISTTSGDGSTWGETGQATLQPDALVDKLAQMNAALKLNPKGSATDYYDLSTHDVQGNSTSRNTANCYVISHPGYYKIPLVYGNAIKNGATNTNAYQTSNTGPYILTNFKDHNDQNITDPWITQSNWGANVPDGAELVWADEKGLVTNLAVTGSGTDAFVQFHVPEDKIKTGNAVIAVTKGSSIVWSWHLWFIHDDALNTVTCTNYQGKEYKLSKETLGMKYTYWQSTSYILPRSVKVKIAQEKGQGSPMTPKEAVITITQKPGLGRNGYQTLYQFGRKDALPGTDSYAEGYYSDYGAHEGYSLGRSIQMAHYSIPRMEKGIHYGDWCNAAYYNLWSANNTTTGFNDNPVVKTIYDPCPAGFKVPASNAFTGFTSNGQYNGTENHTGIWTYGWDFYNKLTNPDATIYFYASGQRNCGGGTVLDYSGQYGYYWLAVPATTDQGCLLAFSRRTYGLAVVTSLNPNAIAERAYSYAIHPVADN